MNDTVVPFPSYLAKWLSHLGQEIVHNHSSFGGLILNSVVGNYFTKHSACTLTIIYVSLKTYIWVQVTWKLKMILTSNHWYAWSVGGCLSLNWLWSRCWFCRQAFLHLSDISHNSSTLLFVIFVISWSATSVSSISYHLMSSCWTTWDSWTGFVVDPSAVSLLVIGGSNDNTGYTTVRMCRSSFSVMILARWAKGAFFDQILWPTSPMLCLTVAWESILIEPFHFMWMGTWIDWKMDRRTLNICNGLEPA